MIYQQKEIRAHSTFHSGRKVFLTSVQQRNVQHKLLTGKRKRKEEKNYIGRKKTAKKKGKKA
jgi:hypothetical protein